MHHAPSVSPAPIHPAPTPTFPPTMTHGPSYASTPQPAAAHALPTAHPVSYARPVMQPTQPGAYKAPNAIEVWSLPDQANNSIPPEIRRQFQTDDHGRVLFFTAPPVESREERDGLKHTARYMAAKAKREQMVAEKRKLEEDQRSQKTALAKKAKVDQQTQAQSQAADLSKKAATIWEDEMVDNLVQDYKRVFGDGWRDALDQELSRLETSP